MGHKDKYMRRLVGKNSKSNSVTQVDGWTSPLSNGQQRTQATETVWAMRNA